MTREFDWDERKRQQILVERRVDLLEAARIFNGEVFTVVDDHENYGEVRLISLGMSRMSASSSSIPNATRSRG